MSTTDTTSETEPAGADFDTDLRCVAETVRDAVRVGHEHNPQFREDALERAREMSRRARDDDVPPAEAAMAVWFFILSLHGEE